MTADERGDGGDGGDAGCGRGDSSEQGTSDSVTPLG
jgi:hypothetical protein